MNTITIFADLFRHLHWADALIWNSVFQSHSALKDQKIRERLHHIHLCQHAWLRIWLGQSVDPHDGETYDLAGLACWARKYHEEVARYWASVQELRLETQVAVPGIEKEMQQPLLWESFLQITMHSTYHRGQVSARLRELGGEPSQTDFITWVIKGKPEARWTSREEYEMCVET